MTFKGKFVLIFVLFCIILFLFLFLFLFFSLLQRKSYFSFLCFQYIHIGNFL